jgi:hypothetical protein
MHSAGRPMKRRSPLSQEMIQTMNQIYSQGKTMREIGNLLSIPLHRVRYCIENPRPNRPRPKHKEA